VYERKDHYWKKAKKEGYRSRAAYKLIEIQKRYRILPRGCRVLDLGSAPGGWIQVIAHAVGPGGRVFGVDRLPVSPLPFAWVACLQGDILDPAFPQKLEVFLGGRVGVVTSDMAPDTTGVPFLDHARSCELVRQALDVSMDVLEPGGTFLAKLFQGEEARELQEGLRRSFRAVRWIVPASSRKASSEIYLLCGDFRKGD
jgi:23S rRNA (uridine2552-2'-O)-methyltransferase